MSQLQQKQRKVIDATRPITVKITQSHQAIASCGNPAKCVVAQALNDAYGDVFDGAQVGTTVTKVFTSDKVLRYATPHQFKRAIPVFDKTGEWGLPEGEYTLRPLSPTSRMGARGNRWGTYRHPKRRSGRDMFGARPLRTRRVQRVEVLAVV